ncbi:hypothetical protein [Methylorubrum populi]|uniref:hypothetical protein n=1 Tax=Methylorubrum TaxID=2282523 RepID=UPI0011537634|nr:hypothetical protein [Methylorubrum populi]QDI80178.1 hypothetical protein E8E01_06930 [Methylorubrum populi]
MRGTSAAIVGALDAALHDPVWSGAVGGAPGLRARRGAFVLLIITRAPYWSVVGPTALGGLALAGA